ncbi:MAG: GNAT family N-acetyltransferase [Chloroflexi bacterium]|nr:GNAT family N-acetyltransferase [Chloroflexota bacterium]
MIQIRSYQEEDLPALVGLINEAAAADHATWGLPPQPTTPQALYHQLHGPYQAPLRDVWVAEAASGAPVGCLRTQLRPGERENLFAAHALVHPAYRGKGLGRRLLQAGLALAQARRPETADGRLVVQVTVDERMTPGCALAESLGLRPTRRFWEMAAPSLVGLPQPALPAGFGWRPLRLPDDLEALADLDRAAFMDHPGEESMTAPEWAHEFAKAHGRPDLCFLAFAHGQAAPAGYSMAEISPEHMAQAGRQEGYIAGLGVRPIWRRRGLGLALLLQALDALRREGMECAYLHMDGDNATSAPRLYRRAGFGPRRCIIAYQTVLQTEERPA